MEVARDEGVVMLGKGGSEVSTVIRACRASSSETCRAFASVLKQCSEKLCWRMSKHALASVQISLTKGCNCKMAKPPAVHSWLRDLALQESQSYASKLTCNDACMQAL